MKLHHSLLAAGLLAATCFTQSAQAQSTDGAHTIQVFPIVADTASFTQRFTFRAENGDNTVIQPVYYPGEGTPQAAIGPIACPAFGVPVGQVITFTSLRQMCPSLAAGSNFGFLYTAEVNAENKPYTAYSRVSNPSGNGFSVEAFPAHTFTAAESRVTGIRRLAATASSPAYQTNCFLANINAAGSVVTTVSYGILNSAGTTLIGSGSVAMVPGRLTRLLDVFAAGGAAAGDYNDAQIVFSESGADEPGLMTFCTVQDNTSFGADFRISKQFADSSFVSPNQQDDHVIRDRAISADILARNFEIDGNVGQANTHVVYFRHPDWVQCEVIDPATGARALNSYGLEMRLLDQNNAVIAGGNDIQGFGEVYLGDKTSRNFGANTRYTIEVENNGNNFTNLRPYRLRCQSGSGHTMGDVIRYKEATDRF
jgi:hypothetical protein